MKSGIIHQIYNHYTSHATKELEKAIGTFFETRPVNPDTTDQIAFGDWFLFDYRMANGRTPLEDFVVTNPLKLPESELAVYRAMEQDQLFDFFTVQAVTPGRGLELESVTFDRRYEVEDVSGSQGLKVGQTICVRVISYGDCYGLSGEIITVPMSFGNLFCESLRKEKKPPTALYAYKQFRSYKQRAKIDELKTLFYNNQTDQSVENQPVAQAADDLQAAERELAAAIRRCGLEGMIDNETIKTWFRLSFNRSTDEQPVQVINWGSLLTGLASTNLAKKTDINRLLEAATRLSNLTPKPDGRIPAEDWNEQDPADNHIVMEQTNPLEWIDSANQGIRFMQGGQYEEARAELDEAFEKLLKHQSTGVEIYRLFANRAVVYLTWGDDYAADRLLKYALSLNPNYQFAQDYLDQLQAGDFDELMLAGRQRQLKEMFDDPDHPFNKWPLDEIERRWSAKRAWETLQTVAKLDLTEVELEEKIKGAYSISCLVREELDSLYQGPAEDNDCLYSCVSAFWRRRCPDQPATEFLSEQIEALVEATDHRPNTKIFARKTEPAVAAVEVYVPCLKDSGFVEAWQWYPEEFRVDTENLTVTLRVLMALDKWRPRAVKLLSAFQAASQAPAMTKLLVEDYYRQNEKKWQSELKAYQTRFPYDLTIFLSLAGLAEEKGQYTDHIDFLEQALRIMEARDREEIYEPAGSSEQGTIFEDYRLVFDLLTDAYKQVGREEDRQTLDDQWQSVKKRQKTIDRWPEREKRSKKVAREIAKLNEEKHQNDSAFRYLEFLQQFNINFTTAKPVGSSTSLTGTFNHPIQKSQAVGRNDPCPCGAVKDDGTPVKYKKCCGRTQ